MSLNNSANAQSSLSSSSNCIIVVSNADGKKYKMVMNGPLENLTVAKVKRYLRSATGLDPVAQVLRFNGKVASDATNGEELGLFDGAVMFLDASPSTMMHPAGSPTSGTAASVGGGSGVGGGYGGGALFHHSSGPHHPDTPSNNYPPHSTTAAHAVTTEYESDRWGDVDRSRAVDERRAESERQELERQVIHDQRQREQEQRAAAEVDRLRAERERQRQFELERQRQRLEEERVILAQRQLEENEREKRERQVLMETTIRHQQHEIDELKRAIHRIEMTNVQPVAPPVAPSGPLRDDGTQPSNGGSSAGGGAYGGHAFARGAVGHQEDHDSFYSGQQQPNHPYHPSANEPNYNEPPPVPPPAERPTPTERLASNLRALAAFFGLECCELDGNNTCIINLQTGPQRESNQYSPPMSRDTGRTGDGASSNQQRSLLLTFDPVTERLYMYSTLSTTVPEDASTRLRLYETLLEGAVLGRDMAGGGVGVSTKSNLILMSTSLDMRHCDDDAAIAIADTFLESVDRWSQVVADITMSAAEPEPVPHRHDGGGARGSGGGSRFAAAGGHSIPSPALSSQQIPRRPQQAANPPATYAALPQAPAQAQSYSSAAAPGGYGQAYQGPFGGGHAPSPHYQNASSAAAGVGSSAVSRSLNMSPSAPSSSQHGNATHPSGGGHSNLTYPTASAVAQRGAAVTQHPPPSYPPPPPPLQQPQQLRGNATATGGPHSQPQRSAAAAVAGSRYQATNNGTYY